jgi:hypothetical protein
MQSIQRIELEWAILHTADSTGEAPRLAEEQLALDVDVRAYFEDHIKSCLKSTQTRMGKFFASDNAIAAGCGRMIEEGVTSFYDVSHAIAWWLQKQIERENGVTADLAICPFIDSDTGDRFIALLKLDPMRVYLKDGDTQAMLQQLLVMPDAAHGLITWAIVRAYNEETRYDLLYRSDDADDYWVPEFLQCEELATPRQMTKLVLGETAKWLDANSENISTEMAMELTQAVREGTQQDMLDLEELAERVIPNEMLRDDFIGRMLDKGMTQLDFQPDREFSERQARKRTYVLDDGVTIQGPSDVIDDLITILPKSDDGMVRLAIETRKFYQK